MGLEKLRRTKEISPGRDLNLDVQSTKEESRSFGSERVYTIK
jgi:hypothetical protein